MFLTNDAPTPKGWRKILSFNWFLLALVCIAVGIGLIMLYGVANGDPKEWMIPQAQRFALGLFLMFFIAFTPMKLWQYASIPIYVSTLLLLVYTVFFGETGGGAARWVSLGPLRIQPSEFAKVAVVLILANYYAVLPSNKKSNPIFMIPAILLIIIPAVLVVVQPDLGTALFIVLIGIGIMFLAGVHWAYYAAGLFAGAVVIVSVGVGLFFYEPENTCKAEQTPYPNWLVSISESSMGGQLRIAAEWAIKPYQYDRIFTFVHPECDPKGDGWQITQGKIALGAGGMNGAGFMKGTQSRLNFLSENHTDFIFTSYAENFGYVGTIFLLCIFGLMSFVISTLSVINNSRYGSMVIGGLGILIFLFYMINLAMVMGLMPVVGVPLPFISYGGSAMLVLCISIGFIQNAHIHRPRKVKQ